MPARHLTLRSILAAAILALLLPVLPAAAAPTPLAPRTPVAPAGVHQTVGPIPCYESSFSPVIELGREQELFLGFRPTDLGGGQFGMYRFDKNPDTAGFSENDLVTDGANSRGFVTGIVGTPADLNGDGRAEFVQSFSDAASRYQLAAYQSNETLRDFVDDAGNHSQRAIAAGKIMGLTSTAAQPLLAEREQVVVASRAPSGALTVQVFNGSDDGGIAGKVATWRSSTNNRNQPTQIKLAVGNLDNDRYADIVVAFFQGSPLAGQLIHLEYEPGYSGGSGDNSAQNLRERSFRTEVLATPLSQRLALADLTGDGRDEVIYAYESRDGSPTNFTIWGYDFVATALARITSRLVSTGTNRFAMATGDLDGFSGATRQDEIVLAYQGSGSNGFGPGLYLEVIRLGGLTAPQPTLETIALLSDGEPTRRTNRYMELVIADLDKDNKGEIVAAFGDTSPFGFQLVRYAFQGGQVPTLSFASSQRHDATFTEPVSLAAADWDGDSLKGVAQGRCEILRESHLTGALFVPPYWGNIQGDVDKEASIGTSVGSGTSSERSLTYTRGHASSAYLGVSAGFSVPNVVEFSASVKATAASEFNTSSSESTAVAAEQVVTTGRSFSDDGVVFEPANYKCYSYQIFDDGVAVPAADGGVRLCEYFVPGAPPGANPPAVLAGTALDGWDVNSGRQTEWAPVARDWASLALFRGAATAQSGNSGNAALAVDSDVVGGSFVGGTVAVTDSAPNPWWQVDLGPAQPITKIRLWAPAASLDNVVVLVADRDFRTISGHENPANLIGQPGVRAYTPADLGIGLAADAPLGEVTTFLTLDSQDKPITGSFVRVQRTDTASLRLAEVQVFGTNHVDPDRYPRDVRDQVAGDGLFEVQLFNPAGVTQAERLPWVEVRGNLLWEGSSPAIGIATQRVSRGAGSSVYWSLSSSGSTTKSIAEGTASNSSIGVEFDVEAGTAVTVLAGGGASLTRGIATESVQSTSWSNSFELGGSVENFPTAYNGSAQQWADSCAYTYQPYSYEASERSSVGFEHSFPVLDYVVPLIETITPDPAQELAVCRNGNRLSAMPQPTSDSTSTVSGAAQTFAVLANDQGNGLRITGVGEAGNGQVRFDPRSVTYTPNPGFIGEDSFSYTVADVAGQTSTGTVTVTVTRHKVTLPLMRRQ